MKKSIFILLIFMANVCSNATLLPLRDFNPSELYNSDTTLANSPNVHISFNEDSTEVTFSVQIINADVTLDTDLYPGKYFWNVPGFYPSNTPGTAALPTRTVIFELPSDAINIRLIENSSMWTTIPNYPPTPARPIKYGDALTTLDDVPPITHENTSKDAAYISQIEKCTNETLVYVSISPFSYDINNNVVNACYEFSYTLAYTPTSVQTRNLQSNDLYSKATRIPYVCEMHRSPSNYLIITTNIFKDLINNYADWKRSFGHGVTILSKNNWTPKEIKDSVSAVYNRTNNLNFLILAGSYSDIPAKLSPTYKYIDKDLFPNGEMRTDFYYSCVNGDDDKTPDIYTGRFIADTHKEMEEIIRKEKSFYTSGLNHPGFFNNAAHVSRFQIYSDNTYSSPPFIKTSEALRDIVIANGKNVERIYDADEGAMPKYINVNGEKTLLPTELQYGNFPWSASTEEVVNQFNSGNFYIMYMAHGAYSGWGQPSFGYYDFHRLNNSNALPIVLSMSCNTGNFVTEDGFARHLLAYENGGAKAIIAAERPSYMGYNDAIAIGMFSTLWPTPKVDSDIIDLDKWVITSLNPIIDPTSTLNVHNHSLGHILYQGLRYMYKMSNPSNISIQEHKEMYHIFGDPGMLMFTETPTEYTTVNYSIDKNTKGPEKWIVTLGTDEDAIIGFYNKSTGVVERFYTNSISREISPSDNYHMTIYNLNKKPFTVDVMDGRTSFSGPVMLNSNQHSSAVLKSSKQVTNDCLEVVANVTSSLTKSTNYTVELLDLNNNLLDTATISETIDTVYLSARSSRTKIVVLRLCENGSPIDYKKIIIK